MDADLDSHTIERHDFLDPDRRRAFAARFPGLHEHAPDGDLLWVDVAAQRTWLLRGLEAVWASPCSTARAGLGHESGSFRTPTGWHEIAARIGGELPRGAVLRGRTWTGETWDGERTRTEDDLVLTRILWLSGREPGVNLGGTVDTRERFIYVHGTNDPASLGLPVSHGCVRLACTAVIELHDLVETGLPVWIG